MIKIAKENEIGDLFGDWAKIYESD